MFELEAAAQERIQAWCCNKPGQKPMTLEVTGSGQERPTAVVLNHVCQAAF